MNPALAEAVERSVAAGRLGEALATLQRALAPLAPALADEATVLAAEWQRLRLSERRDELTPRELAAAHQRLASRVLALRREAMGGPQAAAASPAAGAAVSPAAASSVAPSVAAPAAAPVATPVAPVFISYNHADAPAAQLVRQALADAGVPALMDAEAMAPGQDVAQFVRNSVARSRATVCLISRRSLLSGWVAQETLLASAAEQLGTAATVPGDVSGRPPRRFIALFLDTDFLAPDVRLELTEAIDTQLQHLQGLRARHEQLALDTLDLDADVARLRALRNTLGAVLQRLRGSLCLDLREPARAESLRRLTASLAGAWAPEQQ